MEVSSQADAVRELGIKLVAELGLEESNDTLGRWMAHHVAALIADVDRAEPVDRSAKSAACAEAILQLWSHRSDLQSNHRPLRDWEPVLRALASLDPDDDSPRYFRALRQSAKDEGDPKAAKWLRFADGMDYSARLLVRYALVRAADDAADKGKEWVTLAGEAGAQPGADVLSIRELLRERGVLEGKDLKDGERQAIEDRIARLQEFKRLATAMVKDLRQRAQDAVEGGSG